jgi:hypothetical protein
MIATDMSGSFLQRYVGVGEGGRRGVSVHREGGGLLTNEGVP